MFSKEFMRYLMNYEPAGFEHEEPKTEKVKAIEFKNEHRGLLAKAYVTIKLK